MFGWYTKRMNIYKTKIQKLAGTNYHEVYKKAFAIYSRIRKQSKRRTYVRSAYFNKSKIFLSIFWQHLNDKLNHKDKTRRVKYFPCAIDLVKNNRFDPVSKENVDRKSEILHRFTGETGDKVIFFVQVKEDKSTGEKFLISIFPLDS